MRRLFPILAALALAGCGTLRGDPPPPIQIVAVQEAFAAIAASERTVRARDWSPQERSLIEADLAFAADARTLGAAAAFAKWVAPTGKLVSGGAPMPEGPAGMRAALDGDTAEWRWTPIEAHVSGDLGATMGVAAIKDADAAGALTLRRSRYVTVWRRTADGWRFVLDIGAPYRE